MYCLRDPWGHILVALQADQQPAPVAAAAHPVPLGLGLVDGDRCYLRDGGAWAAPQTQPSWVGYYSCRNHTAVWGPPQGPGIDRSTPMWTVTVGGFTGPLTKVAVATAYLVTTAP